MKWHTALPFVVIAMLASACTSRPAPQETSPEPPLSNPTAAPPTPTMALPTPTVVPTTTGTILTSPDDLIGIWESQVLYELGFHHFREDGTLVIAYTYEDLDERPVFPTPARYWFEGETFHVEDFCGHGTWRLSLKKQEGGSRTLALQLIEDLCDQRKIDWKRPMRWVKP